MLCPNCETEVPDGSFFCAECGADIIDDGDGTAADDACRAVFDEGPSPRRGEEPPLAAGDVGDDDRHGGEAGEIADAGPWGETPAAPAAEETVPVAADSEDLKKFLRPGPDAAAGDLWNDIFADDDGTQVDGYAAVPAPAAGDGEPADEGSFGPFPAADEEEEREDDGSDEDDLRLGAEQDDDAATVPGEPVPVPEDDGDDGDTGEDAAEDDGRIRIREGGRSGPRRRVPMPYDPMEDLMADPSPRSPPAEAGETDPKRPFTMPQLPVIAGAAAVIVIVIIAAVLLMGGGPAGDAGSPAAVAAPEVGGSVVPADAAVPGADVAATPGSGEAIPAFTGSIVLMVTPTFDGYQAVVTGGSRIGEVAMVAITVEDKAGVHTMDWYYPYRGESFVLMRGMYGGIRAQTERVTAEAIFADGQKELVWDEEY